MDAKYEKLYIVDFIVGGKLEIVIYIRIST